MLFLKVLEKQQETPISTGLFAQKMGRHIPLDAAFQFNLTPHFGMYK